MSPRKKKELIKRHDRNHDGHIDARERQEFEANFSRSCKDVAVDTGLLKPGQLTLSARGPMISPRRESRLAHDYDPVTGWESLHARNAPNITDVVVSLPLAGVAGSPMPAESRSDADGAAGRPQSAFVPRPPPGRKPRPGTAVAAGAGKRAPTARQDVPPLRLQQA